MYRQQIESWYLERTIWLVAGIFTLVSAGLAAFVSPYWLILTAFVGLNLIIFSSTGMCIMANILHGLGFRSLAEKSQP